MKKLVIIENLFLSFFVIYFLSCSSMSDKKRPGKQFMLGDLVISSCQHLLDENTELLKYCDKNFSSFSSIRSIAISDSGHLFILTNNCEIIKMNSMGIPILKISSHGQGPGEIMKSKSIKIRNNKLYILDNSNNKVLIYTLSGIWINDIIIKYFVPQTFEVDKDGNIILPHITLRKNKKEPLFIVINNDGKIINTLYENSYIEEDVLRAPLELYLSITPKEELLLVFRTRGVFYLFNFDGELISKFDIHGGPEWKQSIEFEKEMEKDKTFGKSYPIRILDISYDKKGNIYATWSGNFNGEKSIVMIYSSKGEFLGRLFGNDDFPCTPRCFQLENDSTAWIHCFELYTFGKCTLTKRTTE